MFIQSQAEWVEREAALESLQRAFEQGMSLDSTTQLLLLESRYDRVLGVFEQRHKNWCTAAETPENCDCNKS